MKIIDNKKDYYDYLVGYYGLDDYVVYDRRKNDPNCTLDNVVAKSLPRFGKGISVYDTDGETRFKVSLWAGHNMLTKILDVKVDKKAGTKTFVWNDYQEWMKMESRKAWWKYTRHEKEWESRLPKRVTPETPLVLYISEVNYRIHTEDYIITNPILEGSIFTNILSAQEVYEGIYNYLLECKEPKIEDKRNDIEHLESHGFDKKTSFRKM
jgi:hypothetical protein